MFAVQRLIISPIAASKLGNFPTHLLFLHQSSISVQHPILKLGICLTYASKLDDTYISKMGKYPVYFFFLFISMALEK